MRESGDLLLVEMTGINKTYPSNGVKACLQAELRVREGTIHMIVGENGAGKSTLMKILSGDLAADSGTIRYKGKQVNWRHPDQALDAGVGMIHQILHIFPGLTVREHLLLDMKKQKLLSMLDKRRIDRTIASICSTYGLSCSPDESIENLDAEGRQSAALMALISRGTELFILDEPPRPLLKAALRLKQEGKSVIVITHNMEDALAFADTVTIMKRGEHMGSFFSDELTVDELTGLIMGTRDNTSQANARTHAEKKEHPVMNITALTGGRTGTVDWVRDINLSLYAGETVAVAGIMDNGLRALESLCAGYTEFGYTLESGEIEVLGRHPEACPPHMLGYIPSDRLEIGSSVTMSVQENLIIHARRDTSLRHRRFGIYDQKKLERLTESAVREFGIKGSSSHQLITLSGGNIQKLITARALLPAPKLLICADISWGLDVRTRGMLFEKINNLKQRGTAVLMFTSEADVALEQADRIAVLRRGLLAGILTNTHTLTPSDIGEMML
jgi:simple sugar transport system ATP-binding protein